MSSTRILRIVIREGGEEPKVEVSVPLKLAKLALNLLPAVQGEIEKHASVNVDALRNILDEGFDELEQMGPFDLVKIRDGDDEIRISIE